jgi:protein phosphatase PTC7
VRAHFFLQYYCSKHTFRCRQLTKLPVGVKNFSRAVTDFPNQADLYETRLRDGDIVIVYVCNRSHLIITSSLPWIEVPSSSQTDGLSDNVFPSEIIATCNLVARAGGPEDQQVQTMADRIVEYARQCMVNKRRVSPFESEHLSLPRHRCRCLIFCPVFAGDAARQGMYFRGGVRTCIPVVVVV